jgi:hypothetical protein
MQTSRDAQIVAWIGCVGAAGAEHVRERFGMARRTAYRRLASLTADGLLEHRTVLYGWPGMYSATARGLRWQGLERLRVFRVRPGGFEHAWRVAAVTAALHRELPGWRAIGEREIRVLEADGGESVASARVRSTERAAAMLHRPDLALVSPRGRVAAVEVELSVKAPVRLERICRGWCRARHLGHVYYLATPPAARAVTRAVRALRASDMVSVLDLHDIRTLAVRELQREGARSRCGKLTDLALDEGYKIC